MQWGKFTAIPLGIGQWNKQLDAMRQALDHLKHQALGQQYQDHETAVARPLANAQLISAVRAQRKESRHLLLNFYRYAGRHLGANLNPTASARRDQLWERWCGAPDRPGHSLGTETLKYASCVQWDGNATVKNLVEGYLAMAEHRFVLSPPGIGLDTYRVWEALLLGAIPVVSRSTLSQSYAGLPVLIAESWDALNASFLERSWYRVQAKDWAGYAWEKMYIGYWRKLIYSAGAQARGPRRQQQEHYAEQVALESSPHEAHHEGIADYRGLEIALVANVGEWRRVTMLMLAVVSLSALLQAKTNFRRWATAALRSVWSGWPGQCMNSRSDV